MSKVVKLNPLSDKAKAILETLAVIKTGTMAEIDAAGANGITSGHFTALRKRELVDITKEDFTCSECGHTRKGVAVYTINDAGYAELGVEPSVEDEDEVEVE